MKNVEGLQGLVCFLFCPEVFIALETCCTSLGVKVLPVLFQSFSKLRRAFRANWIEQHDQYRRQKERLHPWKWVWVMIAYSWWVYVKLFTFSKGILLIARILKKRKHIQASRSAKDTAERKNVLLSQETINTVQKCIYIYFFTHRYWKTVIQRLLERTKPVSKKKCCYFVQKRTRSTCQSWYLGVYVATYIKNDYSSGDN